MSHSVYLGCFDWKFYALKVYFPGKEDAFNCEVAFLKELHFMHLINMVDYKVDAAVKLKNKDLAITPLLVLELADGGELF